jgi:hypothetical protein
VAKELFIAAHIENDEEMKMKYELEAKKCDCG